LRKAVKSAGMRAPTASRTSFRGGVEMPTEEEMRDPEYCWTCGRKCGSKPHS